jgi:hypothetical protein
MMAYLEVDDDNDDDGTEKSDKLRVILGHYVSKLPVPLAARSLKRVWMWISHAMRL